MSASQLKLAVAQYPITMHADWNAYERHVAAWIAEATHAGAEFLLFPEYGSIELVSLLGSAAELRAMSLQCQLRGLQQFFLSWRRLFADLAVRHRVWIVAPSYPVAMAGDDHRFHNQAWIFAPDGRMACQAKLITTRFEREEWGVSAGSSAALFDTPWARMGVAICYDSEFPLLVRRMVEGGAEVVLVPSCTDTLSGYHRVRGACVARAIENQCFVAQSVTVGQAPWCAAVDVNIGAGGIFAPPEQQHCATGVVSEGAINDVGWIFGTLDMQSIRDIRIQGQVLNHRDWRESETISAVHSVEWEKN